MSLTPSTMQPLGTIAPDFSLKSPDGTVFTLSEQTIDKGLLVIFICNHCPYVIHIRQQLVKKIRDYQSQGVMVVAINANDYLAYPDDSPEKMAEESRIHNYSFAYLVDEDQAVAKAYGAACTPDFFLYSEDGELVYRGQFDSARPGNKEPVTGSDLTAAVEQMLRGDAVSDNQVPSMGCNIKWQSGNEPEYFLK
jgi:peroxiredoxin